MKADDRADYRRTKISALQQLAARGDLAAVRELERRGVVSEGGVDVAALDYQALRALVLAWRSGHMPEDRERSRSLAVLAQAELELRYRVDSGLWDGHGPAPRQVPAPPWLTPQRPRCTDWQRPAGSTLYPSERDLARARFNDMARER